MNLFEAGMLPGIPIGGIIGGVLCRSLGILATIGGVCVGAIAGGFLGWLYAACIIFLISIFSLIWNAIRKRPNLEATEDEYLTIKNITIVPIIIALIGSTIVGFREVWYNGIILSGILAVIISFQSVVIAKYRCSKQKKQE